MSQKTPSDKKSVGLKTKKVTSKTIGPVKDLETHVHPDWWQRIFNSLYLKTDADVVEDSIITQKEVDMYIELLKLKQEDNILDLCCGQGRHVMEFAKRKYKTEGFDRSRYLIHKAKATAKKENLNVKFRQGDARKLPYPADTFDVVMMLGNSFGYFETIKDDLRVLKEIFRVLKPWGKVLLDVTDGEYLKNHFQARSWEWIDNKLFVCRERSLSSDKQRLISREVVSDVSKGVIADQFYAERLYTKEELVNLLKEATFNEAMFHKEIATTTLRNQDLGMMEKRIICTGLVKKDWAPAKKQMSKEIKKVVVLLGDPNQPDPLKPLSVFDDDDFYTIDQMKSALNSLKNYDFTFLSNHNTLFQDLKKYTGKINLILNLCDEGFNNDPRKELHVPSLLEMMDLPYTGSPPQSLAYCYDKSLVRGISKEMGIPVPEAFFIEPDETTFELPINFPVIVKPNFGDSSFGITQDSVTDNLDDLLRSISKIRETFGYDKPILIEEFLTGKDISVGIIGNPAGSCTVLPIIEEDYSLLPEDLPKICGYEAKWLPDSPYWKIRSIPAVLPEEIEKLLIEYCLKLFERLECRDYCRFDWRLDGEGNPKLLEVNPNPGWCWDGHLAKMAKIADMSYPEMLRAILQAAEQRLEFTKMSGSQPVLISGI
ncbi:MAG: methyltransferase domain-containing protein [Spirochaetota bacterium]|nr:methyltransferase domain-containing protein [Spirochaetota bacterium]